LISNPTPFSLSKQLRFTGDAAQWQNTCLTHESLGSIPSTERKKKKEKKENGTYHSTILEFSILASGIGFLVWTSSLPPQWKDTQYNLLTRKRTLSIRPSSVGLDTSQPRILYLEPPA
jgi:hypothetical protein